MVHDRRSMSQRRSAASSPHRRLPKTATRIKARYREPTAAARASTWRSVRTERSGDLFRPAPLMRQGFRRISPSSAAVFIMALSSRYALAVLVGLAPASRRRLRRRRAQRRLFRRGSLYRLHTFSISPAHTRVAVLCNSRVRPAGGICSMFGLRHNGAFPLKGIFGRCCPSLIGFGGALCTRRCDDSGC
jgi:hypothetical protein